MQGKPARSARRRFHGTRRVLARAALSALGTLLGCAHAQETYVVEAPLWRDPDRRPFVAQLEPRFSPKQWNAVEKSLVLPVTNFLSMRGAAEAVNVNSLDEVPDSSWFENRIGLHALSPEDVARGPCDGEPIDARGPWLLKSSKPNGADPGFVVIAPDGRRYLIKLDDNLQGPRTSTADSVASRIYHAAGFNVPCNTVVTFKREIIQIAEGARTENARGEKIPFTSRHLDTVLARVAEQPGGGYRAVASLYLPGGPLGPWAYEGIRSDDRNDVVPHEDRRELRGSRLLAAWTDHSDQHEMNTLAMWIETGDGRGFVRHNLVDFGDCFGSLWEGPVQQAWRREHAYWFDPGQILVDFMTLGLLERPWDRAELGPTGLVFGYYSGQGFDPESWRPSYPNPAFQRMTEHDAAWMARIIARMTEAHIDALVDTARLEPSIRAYLFETLVERRRAILRRYLARLSPLSDVALVERSGEPWLCLRDLAVAAGVAPLDRAYSVQARLASNSRVTRAPMLRLDAPGRPCMRAAELGAETPQGGHWIARVNIDARRDLNGSGHELAPGVPGSIELHLLARGQDVQLIAVERPD